MKITEIKLDEFIRGIEIWKVNSELQHLSRSERDKYFRFFDMIHEEIEKEGHVDTESEFWKDLEKKWLKDETFK